MESTNKSTDEIFDLEKLEQQIPVDKLRVLSESTGRTARNVLKSTDIPEELTQRLSIYSLQRRKAIVMSGRGQQGKKIEARQQGRTGEAGNEINPKNKEGERYIESLWKRTFEDLTGSKANNENFPTIAKYFELDDKTREIDRQRTSSEENRARLVESILARDSLMIGKEEVMQLAAAIREQNIKKIKNSEYRKLKCEQTKIRQQENRFDQMFDR